MSTSHLDPVAALLDAVRNAAREGAEQALAAQRADVPAPPAPLIDKRGLAHALGVSPATIDRFCRDGRIPFVRVGDVRRFDLAAVLSELAKNGHVERSAAQAKGTSKPLRVVGVRLLSRDARGRS